MRAFIIFLILILKFICGYAQYDTLAYPEVGKPMPDFTLKNITYFHKKEASLKDFKNKWLVLDFWSRNCSSCVQSFPETNAIQKFMGDKVQVMLVGIQDPDNQIQKIYSKFREKEKLIMPCAFDSVVAKRFDIGIVPHTIVIDDKGVVRCITYALDTAAIRGFLTGRPPSLLKSYSRMNDGAPDPHISFDYTKPFMVNGNGANDTEFLFKSELSKCDGNIGQQLVTLQIYDSNVRQGRLNISGAPLKRLLEYAYLGRDSGLTWDCKDSANYGKLYCQPRLDIKDSSKFNSSFGEMTDIYNYSLSIPSDSCTLDFIKSAMKRDLETYFGYMASIELRKCRYWQLVALPGTKEKLRTKGGLHTWENILASGFITVNCPFSKVYNRIKATIPDYVSDETNITGNVDIKFDNLSSTNFGDLAKALRANGLDLVPAEKEMKILVIKDKGSVAFDDVNNNDVRDAKFLFRSVLSRWDGNIHQQRVVYKIFDTNVKQGSFQTLGVPLKWLFECAYIGQACMPAWDRRDTAHYGNFYHKLILKIKDSSRFNHSFSESRHIYSYSLFMPPACCTLKSMKEAMQRNLETYFGYVGDIEIRRCPYWKLIALPGTAEKLRAKGGPSTWTDVRHAGFSANNYPFYKISDWIKAGLPDYISDETNISGNVDITLDCIPFNFDDLRQALRKAGLDLIPAEKDMKVLVIRDAKPAAPEGSGGGQVTNR